eukprot:3347788-Pleurochrysis_carterae.AAC.1
MFPKRPKRQSRKLDFSILATSILSWLFVPRRQIRGSELARDYRRRILKMFQKARHQNSCSLNINKAQHLRPGTI